MTASDTVTRPDLQPRTRTRAPWALALVALALVALAAVPIYVGERVASLQDQITETLQPALESAARLSLSQSRQMARLQSFMLTGDGTIRLRYNAAIAEEDNLYNDLGNLVRFMDFEVRERLAQLSAESTRWRFEHLSVFDEVVGPEVRTGLRVEIQEEYDELQRATRELERAIKSEVDQGRRDTQWWRTVQTRITIGLAILALGSLLVIARVSWRVRRLVTQAENRRIDAVRSRREIDALLEATGDGVLGIDLEGRALSLNRVGTSLLGYTEEEIRGRDVHDTVHHTTSTGEPRARKGSKIIESIKMGGRSDSEEGDILWRRDRTSFPVRWSLHPLLDGTDLRGSVLTFTDMTEVREREDALRRTVEQRDEVVSIVSHDLRNPLGVVAAAADTLIDLPLDREEREKQAKIIARSASRMSRLIEDLLDVARIEAGAFVVRPAAEEPRSVLKEVRDMFEGQADQAQVALTIGSVCDVLVLMDHDRVVQALANLVDNAVRFTPEGGSIALSAEALDEETVSLSVCDTGVGLAQDVLEHLFNRFWQAEGDSRGRAGLGLTIVRGVAEAHGGEVRVESDPGVGSTFHLALPRA